MIGSRLNPLRHLGIQLFLWFWLGSFVIVMAVLWISRQVSDDVSMQPLPAPGSSILRNEVARLDDSMMRFADQPVAEVVNRYARHHRRLVVAVDVLNEQVLSGAPGPFRGNTDVFLELANQLQPMTIKTSQARYFGPVAVTWRDQQYAVFVGKPLPPNLVRRVHQRHPILLISVVLVISASLCGLLAWRLLRPVRHLRLAVNQMAKGDLKSRVDAQWLGNNELGQLGHDFNAMASQLEQLVDGQKRLLADISHELRSPLARLQLAIGITEQSSEGNNTPGLTEGLARIEKEAQQIEQMLAQLLVLARMEATQMPMHPETLDVSALLGSCVEDARFQAVAQGKQVFYSPDCALHWQGDRELLTRVFNNVLGNAVRYASTKVQVQCTTTPHTLEIRIQDDGPGIAEEALKQIFTPFYRMSASRQRETGGVGLGLAIVHQAVLLHGGSVTATNVADGGLCIDIRLPRRPVER
ncbi:HAMP domain-containing protein [Aestuariibacter halophilus]|uniref:histidine kinase n=1 Tax=Fluctibacter halophilus TaxID=226011 RepID=A0ABS8G9U9_9ALTE|nr:ATP-binding protein [Aestuariibacter halophilus]MCC2617362.1 HAMP domain-containing protein [Aestuariibacter halophilus]